MKSAYIGKKHFVGLLLFVFCVVLLLPAGALSLKSSDSSINLPFSVSNMFPGDKVTNTFEVDISDRSSKTVHFHADIREGHEKLAEVLMLKIEVEGTVLYDGLMRDMPLSADHELPRSQDKVDYDITVYLDTSVGNDYQAKTLVADFRWWYTPSSSGGPDVGGDTDPDIDEDDLTKPLPAEIKLVAEVLVDREYPRGNDFVFVLKDQNGDVIQTVRNKDGLIEFDSFKIKKLGSFTYYIEQISDERDDMELDDSVYTVIITTKSVDDKLVPYVTYLKNGRPYSAIPRFSNYTIPPDVTKDTEDVTSEPEGTDTDDSSTDTDKPDKPVEYPENPKTGDDFNLGLTVAAVIISLLTFIFFFIVLKRKGEKDE